MKIRWTQRARKSVNEVGEYILKTFGKSSLDKFINELLHNVSLLEDSPNLGRKEPLLEKRSFAYQSLVVNKLSKIIYRIDGEIIYIVDVWETRRAPRTLTKGLS